MWKTGCDAFKRSNLFFPLIQGLKGLPIDWDPSFSAKEQRDIGRHLFQNLEFSDLSGMSLMLQMPSLYSSASRVVHELWEHVWENLICPFVSTEINTNLLGPQNELLI